jgi:hypothetical protein
MGDCRAIAITPGGGWRCALEEGHQCGHHDPDRGQWPAGLADRVGEPIDAEDVDESRDLVVEAGRIVRGTTFAIGTAAHVRALVDEVGGALAALVDATAGARVNALPGVNEARAHAAGVLLRLEAVTEDEATWRETFGKLE